MTTHRPRRGRPKRDRTLSVEPLESRIALAAAGLIEVGAQPSGGLDDKIVYLHGGHGYTADNLGNGSWTSQRPLLLGMVEDMGNQDQMSLLAQYLFDAGATVVPLRPVGHQPNEVVLDNDDAGVTFTGAWSDSTASVYFGDAGDVPYRYASTSATETATARYQPNLPESGFYPVYAWARYGSDRAADQIYRVGHSGGATEVTIDHRRVGNGVVYLGTYYFEAGGDNYVEISNQSSESGRVVIADMIRFGNGVGDINRGGGVSGFDREDEAGLYWIQWHVDRSQGIPTSAYRASSADRDATVSAAPRYAAYMNRESDGSLSDRLFVSFHSNAGGGRGVVGLHNTSHGGDTPNQFFLAQTLAAQVNDDLVAQNGEYEHDWFNRTSLTFEASFNYGEINNSYINSEFDATIVETAFHDNAADAQLMRDARVRDAIARATYQGIVDYFHALDSGATPDADAPSRPTGVRVETQASGEVVVHWTSGDANSHAGGAAIGYTVYASADGYGFDGGRFVAGGGAASLTISGLDPNQAYYFKVVANSQGGQSPASEVVAAAATGGDERVLIVNGFDRLDRSLNPTQTFVQGGQLERVRPRQSNSYDYAVQMASALRAASPDLAIDTAANEAIAGGDVSPAEYDAVFWILGEESSADSTFDAVEQNAVATYLAGGGKLFVSGAEIGWDLDHLGNGQAFYNQTLRAEYLADDANTYQADGAVGSIFEGIDLTFDNGAQFYDVDFPDVIIPVGGSSAALNYANGAGAAGVQYGLEDERLVMLAFPFETITDAADRTLVMSRVLEFFDSGEGGQPTVTIERVLDNDAGAPTYTSTAGWLTSSDPGYNGGAFQFNLVGSAGEAQWRTDLPLAGTAQVYVQYPAAANRATGAYFQAESGTQSVGRHINQATNNLQWVLVGSLAVEPGELTVTLDVDASTGAANAVIVADAVRVVLTAPVTPSGDFNDDGFVNSADYTVWRDQLGQSVTHGAGADGNYDGQVDSADYQLWREQFGTVVAAPSAAAQPIGAPSVDPTQTTSEIEPVAAWPLGWLSERPARALVAPHRPTPIDERASPQWTDAAFAQIEADLSLHRRPHEVPPGDPLPSAPEQSGNSDEASTVGRPWCSLAVNPTGAGLR